MTTAKDTKDVANLAATQDMTKDVDVGEVFDSCEVGGERLPNDLADALACYQPGSKEENHILRKIDFMLLPILWLMCVLAYVDRNNIGNAEAAGMNSDLGLSDTDYSMLISIFFIAYVVWEVPSNITLSRTRPSYYLPAIMVAWGALVSGMSQVKNYHDILICRFFLGIIEAGFFPGVLYIMTSWYKKDEIGKRFSMFFTALCVAGAVSGLISGAVISGLEGVNGMRGWRWLFLIEGICTICIGIAALFILPDFPHNPQRRVSAEQRLLATVRLMHDKAETAAMRRGKVLTPWQSVKAAVVDLRTYFFIILYMTQNGSTTISYFIPTVLESMGYEGTMKQWMTVPIWVVGIVFLLVFPQTSDRTGDRRWHIAGCLALAFVSSIISLTVNYNNNVRYAFMCFYIAGLYITLPLILNWASELMSFPAEKRAVVIAMVNCVGSISSIYGSYLWPSSDAPHYTTGFATVSSFIGVGVLLAAALPIIFRYLPRYVTEAERELEGEEHTGESD